MSIISQPEATLYAAAIAAMVSMVSLLVTLRSSRNLGLLVHYGDETKEIRKRLRDLSELLHRVETSARRLVALTPHLNPDQLMIDATHTLAIVSDVFRATGSDRVIDYPKKVVDRTQNVRKKLTQLFLELDMSEKRKNPEVQETLTHSFNELSQCIEKCNEEIREVILPRGSA